MDEPVPKARPWAIVPKSPDIKPPDCGCCARACIGGAAGGGGVWAGGGGLRAGGGGVRTTGRGGAAGAERRPELRGIVPNRVQESCRGSSLEFDYCNLTLTKSIPL